MQDILPDFLHDPFARTTALLLITSLIGALGLALRQPLIITFLLVGLLLGPAGFAVVKPEDPIQVLAEVGVALLLFVVGLRLDPQIVRRMGSVVLAVGLGQIVLTALSGFFLCLLLRLGVLASVYVSLALTLSSTIVVVKLLTDTKELDSLHGKIALGIVIVQDLVIIGVLVGLSAFQQPNVSSAIGQDAAFRMAKGVGLLFALALLMRWVLPSFTEFVAKLPDLLTLFGIAWALTLAVTAEFVGLSREVGAFLAGFSLAPSPYREALASRLASLRDFLILFFFVVVGSQIDREMLRAEALPAIILSLFVLVGNPLLVLIIMGWMGYRRRTSFKTGLAIAQISEFSLILASLGRELGHINRESVGLITVVGIVTIGASVYLILYSDKLYEYLSPFLRIFERKTLHKEERLHFGHTPLADVILYGLGRYGSSILKGLQNAGHRVLGVDFDPERVRECRELGAEVLYGDAEDPEFPNILPLNTAKWVISSIPDLHVNLGLIHAFRTRGFQGKIAVTAHQSDDASFLKERGADVVLLPFEDAGAEVAHKLQHA
ncbi:MAG: cation:proton antiporter [Fimbriimonadales bacterium]|nr:cation:proton antiporter [Fimbriimonadales bacterium]